MNPQLSTQIHVFLEEHEEDNRHALFNDIKLT